MIEFSFDQTIDFKVTDDELTRISIKYPSLTEPDDLKFFAILSRYLDPLLVLSELEENGIHYFEIMPIDSKAFLVFRYDASKNSIIMNPYTPMTDEVANWMSEQHGISMMRDEICTFIFFHELGHKRHPEKIKELNELEKMGKADFKALYNEIETEANNFAKEKFLQWKKIMEP